MLLSEIVFLREKNKSKIPGSIKRPEKNIKGNLSQSHSRILDMHSQKSLDLDDQGGKN